MVALNENLNKIEKVIFVTPDKELDALMLEAYPRFIKGEQHRIEIVDGKKVYVFDLRDIGTALKK